MQVQMSVFGQSMENSMEHERQKSSYKLQRLREIAEGDYPERMEHDSQSLCALILTVLDGREETWLEEG